MVLKKKGNLLVYATFSFLMVFFALFFVFDLYSDFKNRRNIQLKNNSYLLGEWIRDSFKSSEYLLMNIIDQVPLEHIEYPPSDMKRYYQYKDKIEKNMLSFPYATFSGIIDKNGILSHTNSVDGFDLSDRDFFLEMKNKPAKRSVLSNAFKSPEGYYYVVQGLNYENNKSDFNAMAVIGVSLDFFTEWINKLAHEGSGRISIIDLNGKLLAHNFSDKSAIGRKFSVFNLEDLNTEKLEFKTFSIKSANSHFRRFFAIRKIVDLPFYVIIEEEDTAFSALALPMLMVAIGIFLIIALATTVLRSQLSLITIHTELERTSLELKAIFEHSMVGIFLLGGDKRILQVNPRFAEIAGYDSPEDVRGRDTAEIHISKEKCEIFRNFYLNAFKEGDTVDIEYEFRRKDGNSIWLRAFGKTIDDKVPPDFSKGIIWIIDDISERRETRAKLLKMATTDSMTGINNRQHFTELGSREFAIFERHGHPVSVLMFDLDFFKSINDTYGHNTGDEAIIHFADICIQNLRAEDILGRIGGEEFAAVLPATDIDAAFKVADRIREKTESTAITHPDGNILLTVSIGVTTVETKPASLAIALQQADKALYEAKNSGRNKVVLYSADKTQ